MIEAFVILFLIFMNGVFCVAEVALISVRKNKLQNEVDETGDKKAKEALVLAKDPDKFLSSVQTGITAVSILTGIFSGNKIALALSGLFRDAGLSDGLSSFLAKTLIVLMVMFLTILFGELVPKRIAMANPEKWAKRISPFLKVFDFIAAPFIALLSKCTAFISRKLGVSGSEERVTEDDIVSMVQEGTAAMIYEEVQNVINYDKALGTENWGYFDFPEIDGEKGEAGYITGGPDLFVVNANTKYPEQCIRFLKYLTSDEVQSKMVYDLGFLPTTTVELDESKCVPNEPEIIKKNLEAPGVSEWLDSVLDQTVSQTYLEGCQSIFGGDDGKTIMANVTETAKEVKADE